MQSIDIPLGLERLETDPDPLPGLQCPTCHSRPTLLQPEIDSPDRLLAVCPGCRGWFLVDITCAVMIRLPDQDALRDV